MDTLAEDGISEPMMPGGEDAPRRVGVLDRFREMVTGVMSRGRKLNRESQGSVSSLLDYHLWSSGEDALGPKKQWLFDALGELEKLDMTFGIGTPVSSTSSSAEPRMVWSEENVNKLLGGYGRVVIREKIGEEKTLLQHSIIDQQFECARVLFDYAEEKKLIVDLDWSDNDILGYSLKTLYSREAVQFVLERMSNRCADAKQTAHILSKHLKDLIALFPDVFEKFIEDDKFCFEYGRFLVPKSLFNGITEKPIGMISDHQFTWRGVSEKETETFWVENCPDLKAKIDNAKEGEKITAVSKFACIEDAVFVNDKSSIADLVLAKCSVDIFACETIRTNVQWKWHTYLKRRFIFSNLMYLASVVFFVLFAAYYGDIAHVHEDAESESNSQPTNRAGARGGSSSVGRSPHSAVHHNWRPEGSEWELLLARISICFSFGFLIFPLLAQPSSFIWSFLGGVETTLYLLIHSFVMDKHTAFSAGVVSVHCLIIIFKSFRYLRPFRWFGPFVTMVYYVLKDIMPFMILGAIVVFNFSIGLFVLIGRSYQFRDKEDPKTERKDTASDNGESAIDEMIELYERCFVSVGRTFEYMLYSLLGQFSPEVFHLSANSQFSAWITGFFCIYLLIAAIVLLSLLISVLGNTFDKVVLHEEGEFIKHRAQAVVAFERISLLAKRLKLKLHNFFRCRADPMPAKFRYHGGNIVPADEKLHIFHFLVPAVPSIIEDTSAWHGRINAVVQRTRAEVRQTEENAVKDRESLKKDLKKDLKQAHDDMEEFKAEVRDVMDTSREEYSDGFKQLVAQLQSLEGKLDALSSKLDPVQQSSSHS